MRYFGGVHSLLFSRWSRNLLFLKQDAQWSTVTSLKESKIVLSMLKPILFTRQFSLWWLKILFTLLNTASMGENYGLYGTLYMGTISSLFHHSLKSIALCTLRLSIKSETGVFFIYRLSYFKKLRNMFASIPSSKIYVNPMPPCSVIVAITFR